MRVPVLMQIPKRIAKEEYLCCPPAGIGAAGRQFHHHPNHRAMMLER